MAAKSKRAQQTAPVKEPWAYALFQSREQLERPHAQRWIEGFHARWRLEAGLDEEAARRAPVVYLVGACDFFPAHPLARTTEVYRVCPRSCEDPDDTEAVLHAVLHGLALPAVERDPRAREEG
jgi:hypothetical protein